MNHNLITLLLIPLLSFDQSSSKYFSQAYEKQNSGDYKEALIAYNKFIALNSMAILKYVLKDYNGSISDFTNAIQINPSDNTAFYNRADVKAVLSECLAIKDCSKALELEPLDAYTHCNRGFYYSKIGDYKSSLKDFNYIISYHSGEIDGIDDNSINNKSVDYFNKSIAKYNLDEKEGLCRDEIIARELGNPSNKIKDFQCE